MKKARWSLILVAIVLVSMVWAGPVLAKYSGYHGSGSGSGKGLEAKLFHKAYFILRNEKELELTEEQVQSVRDIKHDAKKRLIRQDAEIGVLGVDIRSKLYDNPVDVEAIHDLIDQKYAVKIEKAKGLVDSFAALKAILGEEQWTKLKELWKAQS